MQGRGRSDLTLLAVIELVSFSHGGILGKLMGSRHVALNEHSSRGSGFR